MKKKIIIILTIIIVFIFLLTACKNQNRIDELEDMVTELQEELSSKEGTIKELQQESNRLEEELKENIQSDEEKSKENLEASSELSQNDEEKIIDTINNYLDAVEKEDFDKQRRFAGKYVLDLINLKEFENKHSIGAESRTIDRQTPKIGSIGTDNAKGYISFTEHIKGFDGSSYDLVTEGKIYLENIEGNWKIVDYTRKNRLISEALYFFKELSKTHKDITISINWILFSIFDEYIALNISIINDTDIKLGTNMYSSTIIGPDRIQNEMISLMGDLNEVFPGAIAIGDLTYNWTNDSAGNITVYFGDIYNDENYDDIINDLTFEIDLSEAIRY